MTAVHQFVQIGSHALVGGGTLLNKDVPPYVRISRFPASYIGVNTIGLRRRGFTSEKIRSIQGIYHKLFVENKNISKGIIAIDESIEDSDEKNLILQFARASKNGLIKGLKRRGKADLHFHFTQSMKCLVRIFTKPVVPFTTACKSYNKSSQKT